MRSHRFIYATFFMVSCSLLGHEALASRVASQEHKTTHRLSRNRQVLQSPPIDPYAYELLDEESKKGVDEKISFLKQHVGKLARAYGRIIAAIAKDDSDDAIELKSIIQRMSEIETSNDVPIHLIVDESTQLTARLVGLMARLLLRMCATHKWEDIYPIRAAILWNLAADGNLSEEEAELYENDDLAWTKELFHIWEAIYSSAN